MVVRMSKPKRIKVTHEVSPYDMVNNAVDFDVNRGIPISLRTFIVGLHNLEMQFNLLGYEHATIELSDDGHEDKVKYFIIREETDYEYKKRLEKAQREKEKVEKNEKDTKEQRRKQYEKLRKEFGREDQY
jgi:hypothetical protein